MFQQAQQKSSSLYDPQPFDHVNQMSGETSMLNRLILHVIFLLMQGQI